MRRTTTRLTSLLTVTAFLALAAACQRSNGQELPVGETPAATAQAPAEPAAGRTSGPTYTIEHAAVTLAPAASGELELRVTPTPGFKVNLLYPWDLTLSTGDPVTIERTEWDNASAQTFTEQEAVFRLPVEATQSGTYEVSGDLRFSICNEHRCQTPTAQVGWAVTVE